MTVENVFNRRDIIFSDNVVVYHMNPLNQESFDAALWMIHPNRDSELSCANTVVRAALEKAKANL